MKFLVLRFSSIGDIVLTTPVIRCLKQQVPDAEVHFLTKDAFHPVIAANPYIDKIHVLAHSWELMMEELKLEDYDHIIDLHHNLRTMRVKSALAKPSHAFNKINIRKWIYVNFKTNLMPGIHIVDRYMETVKSFGVKNDGTGLDYFIPEKEVTKLSDIPTSHHAGYIGLVIGAAHATKKLPVNKLKEICEKLNHPIMLMGGKEDVAAGEEISSVDPVKVYNACGKFSINESADLVKKSKVIISHDTGLMHIATAFKKQVISVWGNTVPSFGMYPYYGQNFLSFQQESPYDIIQVNKLWCRPCSKIGYDKCPRGHFKCMNNISIDEIVERVKHRLLKAV
jgi:ADP-heptose:LPS heptosyltransferase